MSGPVFLAAGRKYYIEALHKEANGNDYISVGWQLPDGTLERPVPGNRLIPYRDPDMTVAHTDMETIDGINARESSAFTLYPNPSTKRDVTLTLAGNNAKDLHTARWKLYLPAVS